MLQWHTSETNFDWGSHHQQAVARHHGLSLAVVAQLIDQARALVQGDLAWLWCGDQLAWWGNEVAISYRGRVLRLDRLIQTHEGVWWIIDFKTTATPLKHPDLVRQLMQYRQAVLNMHTQNHQRPVVRAAFITPQGGWFEVC